jgi:hypothetical protein
MAVKLDPEERVIAAALDQAELDDANHEGAEVQIELKRDGHASELVQPGRAPDLTI